MKTKLLILLATFLTLAAATACTFSTDRSESSQKPVASPTASKADAAKAQSNLVALFLVKKDNLNNQFKGEVFPIALHINGSYLDASRDITREIRDNFDEEILIRNQQQQTPLHAIKTFAVINGATAPGKNFLGKFTVNRLAVSQFACSSFLVGQGEFEGSQPLSSIFETIPADRSGGFSGSIGNKQFDETWRWAIATSHSTPVPTVNPPAATDETRYRQDLLNAAQTAITKSGKGEGIGGEPVIESISIFDLDRDGQPEVFGTIRKGLDPKSITNRERGQSGNVTVYANVWLSYKTNQPIVIAQEIVPYQFPVSRRPYDVAGVVDVDGDGIEEVIVRNNGYESTSFGIYQYKNSQLTPVFDGAGYGC